MLEYTAFRWPSVVKREAVVASVESWPRRAIVAVVPAASSSEQRPDYASQIRQLRPTTRHDGNCAGKKKFTINYNL